MDRRKFAVLALSGILFPEYLLKGRSMISVPSMLPPEGLYKFDIETPKNNLAYQNIIISDRPNVIYKLEYRKIGDTVWKTI